MSVNKHQPHVLVLPEDDANRQLANGFHLQMDSDRQRRLQVLKVAGGWNEVLKLFESEHVVQMGRWPSRFMVLLIDFDGREERLALAKARIPGDLVDRVFVLGVLREPEALRVDLGTAESIGAKLADECREDTYAIWEHALLRHNASELNRLRDRVRTILFPV